MVWLPSCLAAEISLVLGTTIAERLPTREAAAWRKALAPWDEVQGKGKPKTVPQASWPVEAVLFVYPGKRSYGEGELILWELKLLGQSADHGLFLEVILPAMEAAATTTDPRWPRQSGLWGHFDITGVYAARGNHWEPLVQEGKLDLRHSPTPVQWAEGLTFQADRVGKRLTWLTPFDLSPAGSRRRSGKRIPAGEVPTLPRLLESLIARMTIFLPGKRHTPDDVWNSLSAEERASLQAALEQAAQAPLRERDLRHAPKEWPGLWIGRQTFAAIPSSVIPYLELASILHVGNQTHYGCGTFVIT
ncbi:MAG: CRISPR system precrRNA processing endoribonuclease RAMP protein Cas6 [Anaerolineae bacterium]|nr:CRISPR system precrRNA processing endoribonuclease RAMP protein Cas6 [Anaerolineae bacterium]